ncbi:MAG: alpha-L-rhamnosidase [Acidobacteria bacterium]|nr:alpha-L-rhamnosidase [Acidobacteriota bacterium]
MKSLSFILSGAAMLAPGVLPPAAALDTSPPISDAVLHRPWTGQWIECAGAPQRDAGVYRFRKVIGLPDKPERFVVHVSGDNRFVLHVNGQRVGAGPARGDKYHWRFESFDLAPFLQPGRNLLSAVVWNFGTDAPGAQVSLRTGFVVQGDGSAEEAAHTDATWQCAPEPGHQPWPEGALELRAQQYFVVGPGERLDAAQYDWDWARLPETSAPVGRWTAAVPYGAPSPRTITEGPGYALSPEGRLLVPDPLPPMEYRDVPAGEVVRSSGVTVQGGFPASAGATVPAGSRASLLLDRGALLAGYPELVFSGGRGARVRLTYQEALVGDGFRKGNRNEIEGKHMVGLSDEVRPDGGAARVFHPLWWRTWRYLEIDVETAEDPLTLDALRAHATGYPFEEKARVDAGDETLGQIWKVGWRTARLCAHETYMDCPYYEQLQYVGDTRIQALISYVVTGDGRLARQAIEAYDRSRRSDGITSSRYPAAEPQYIPPFSLLWVGMIHDFWRYRDDPEFVRAQLPGSRTVLDWFLGHQRSDGLLGAMPWWIFLDWAADFPAGVPPQEPDGQSAPITLQMVSALREAAELEDALGDPHRARVYRARATEAADAVFRLCWDERRGLLADRPSKDRFSQHTNILGILSDALPAESRGAILDRVLAAGTLSYRDGAGPETAAARGGLTKASYYFRFYLSRALEKLGRGDEYLSQLEPWREMLELGLSTWAETPDDASRSDCHAWSAHPNYDLLTIVAGIRPGAPGFRTVRIEPSLGTLDRFEASMPHERGLISVSYRRQGSALETRIVLPPGLPGEFAWRGVTRALQAGEQSFRME